MAMRQFRTSLVKIGDSAIYINGRRYTQVELDEIDDRRNNDTYAELLECVESIKSKGTGVNRQTRPLYASV